jgi:hypothetical protein
MNADQKLRVYQWLVFVAVYTLSALIYVPLTPTKDNWKTRRMLFWNVSPTETADYEAAGKKVLGGTIGATLVFAVAFVLDGRKRQDSN